MSHSAFGPQIVTSLGTGSSTQQTISSPKSKSSVDNAHNNDHHHRTSQMFGAARSTALISQPPSGAGGGEGTASTSHKPHAEDQLLWTQLELQLEQERSRSRDNILRTMAKKMMKLQDKADEQRILTALMSVQLEEQVTRLNLVQDASEEFFSITSLYASAIQHVLNDEKHKNITLHIELQKEVGNTKFIAANGESHVRSYNQPTLESGVAAALLLEKPSKKGDVSSSSRHQQLNAAHPTPTQQHPSSTHPSIRRSSPAPSSPLWNSGGSPKTIGNSDGGGSPSQREQHRYFIPEQRSAFSEYANTFSKSAIDDEAELNRRFDDVTFAGNDPNHLQHLQPHFIDHHDVNFYSEDDYEHHLHSLSNKGDQERRRASYHSTSSIGGLIHTPRRVVSGGVGLGGTPTMAPTLQRTTPVPHIELGTLNLSQHENTPTHQQSRPLPVITTPFMGGGSAMDGSRRLSRGVTASTPRFINNNTTNDVHSRLELLLFKERYHLEEYSEAVGRASLVKREISDWNEITSAHQQEGWSAECCRVAEYYDQEISTLEATVWAKAQEHFSSKMKEFTDAASYKSDLESQSMNILQEEMIARLKLESYMLFGSVTTNSTMDPTFVADKDDGKEEEPRGPSNQEDEVDKSPADEVEEQSSKEIRNATNSNSYYSGGLLGMYMKASREINEYRQLEAIQVAKSDCKVSVDDMKAKVERTLHTSILTRQECKKDVLQAEEVARQVTTTMTKLHASQISEVQAELSSVKRQLDGSNQTTERLRAQIADMEENLSSAWNSITALREANQREVSVLQNKVYSLESDLAEALRDKTSLAIDHNAIVLDLQKNFEEKDGDRRMTINDLRQTITLQNESILQSKLDVETIKADGEKMWSAQINTVADDVEWRLAGIEGRMSQLLAEVGMVMQSPSAANFGATPIQRIEHALETFQEHFDVLLSTLSEMAKEQQEQAARDEEASKRTSQNTQTDPIPDKEENDCKCKMAGNNDHGDSIDVPPSPTTAHTTNNLFDHNGSFPSHLVLPQGTVQSSGGGAHLRQPMLCEGCQCRISVSPPIATNSTSLHGMLLSVSGAGSRENSQNVISYSPSSNYNSTPPQAAFHVRNNSNVSTAGGYDNMSFGQVSTTTTAALATGLLQPVLKINDNLTPVSFTCYPLLKLLEEEESSARMHIAFAAASIVKFSTARRNMLGGRVGQQCENSPAAAAASTSNGPSLRDTPNRVTTVPPTVHRQRSNTTPASMSPPPQPFSHAIPTSDTLDEPESPSPRLLSPALPGVLPHPPSVRDFYTSTPNAVVGSAEDLTTSTVAAHSSFYQQLVRTTSTTNPPVNGGTEEGERSSSSMECPRVPTTNTFGGDPFITQPPFFAGTRKQHHPREYEDEGGMFAGWFEGVREIVHHWSEEQLYSQLAPTLEELEQNYEVVRAQVRQQQQHFGSTNRSPTTTENRQL